MSECPACGSSNEDREKYALQNNEPYIAKKFKTCPHCGAEKCVMCDMGDDVECLSCGGNDDDAD